MSTCSILLPYRTWKVKFLREPQCVPYYNILLLYSRSSTPHWLMFHLVLRKSLLPSFSKNSYSTSFHPISDLPCFTSILSLYSQSSAAALGLSPGIVSDKAWEWALLSKCPVCESSHYKVCCLCLSWNCNLDNSVIRLNFWAA